MLVMVVDDEGRLTWIDGAVERLTGYQADELVGTNILDHLDVDWNPAAFDSIEAAMSRTGLQRPMLYRVRRKDGSAFVAEVTANSQLDDPVMQGLAVYVRQWDERHLLDQVIESLASSAPLETTLELLTQVMGAETLDGDGFVLLRPTRQGFAQTVSHLTVDPVLAGPDAGPHPPWELAAKQHAPVWRRRDDLPEPMRSAATRHGYRWCWSVAGGCGRAGRGLPRAVASMSTRNPITPAACCCPRWCASPGSCSSNSEPPNDCVTPRPTTR